MRRSVLRALLLGLLLALTGCVAVPTAGPVEKVEGEQPACQDCVNVEVAPPSPGDEPLEIVQGFLRANANYQPNYAVARQFLTKAAAQKWSPEDGVSVYSGSPVAVGVSVLLDARLVGALGPDRTYSARNEKLQVNFGVVKVGADWRISTPPPGLLVAQYSFGAFYQSYNLYFIGNGATLVPDPIFLPSVRSQASLASVLVKSLLAGPSDWLKPAVSSVIPPNTALSVDSVTVSNGIAEVPLSEAVLQLNDQQRALMAAQVVYTLLQTGIQSVVFVVDQQPFRVPGSNETDFSVTVESIPRDVQPIPAEGGSDLYVVRNRRVQTLDVASNSTTAASIPGPFGAGRMAVDSLAVSVANTDLAAVTDRRTHLLRSPTGGGAVSTLLEGVGELLRPQFSRYGELWTFGRVAGHQQLVVFSGDDRQRVQAEQVLTRGTVSAFRLSPDGSRIALVLTAGGVSTLALARITRADAVIVDGLRTLDTVETSGGALRQIRDVAWIDATHLLVLGAPTAAGVPTTYRVSQDASSVSPDAEPTNWDAAEVAVQVRTQSALIVGRRGQTWKDAGSQWLPFVDKVTTAAFPG